MIVGFLFYVEYKTEKKRNMDRLIFFLIFGILINVFCGVHFDIIICILWIGMQKEEMQ